MSKIMDATCTVSGVFGFVVVLMYLCVLDCTSPIVNAIGMGLAAIATVYLAALVILAVLSGVCYYKMRTRKSK